MSSDFVTKTAKMYSFNAGSFNLPPPVEDLLRSRGAISLDFGSSAYLNAESMPSILYELLMMSMVAKQSEKTDSDHSIENNGVIEGLKRQVFLGEEEKKRLLGQIAKLDSEKSSSTSEITVLKQQVLNFTKIIDDLTKENLKIKSQLPVKVAEGQLVSSTPQMATINPEFERLKESYGKLQKEFQSLRSQNIEAITSLKVLEEENEELAKELDSIKSQTMTKSASVVTK